MRSAIVPGGVFPDYELPANTMPAKSASTALSVAEPTTPGSYWRFLHNER